MAGIDFGIDGECDVVRLAEDYYVARLSVLMDDPAIPELVSLDVYVRSSYDIGNVGVVAAVPQDCGKHGWGVTPELEKWCHGHDMDMFIAQLLQQEYDMGCPS